MRIRTLAAALLFLAFGVQSLLTIRATSLAGDEAKHLATGLTHLTERRCCLGVDNSPGTALPALALLAVGARIDASFETGVDAWRAGRELLSRSPAPDAVLATARIGTLLTGFLLLWVASRLAEDLYGRGAGLLTLALLAFDPTLIAHFSLVSPDALLAAAAVIAAWRLERMWRRPTVVNAVLAGAAVGATFLAKFTGAVMVAAAAGLWPLAHWRSLRERGVGFWAGRLALAAATGAAAVWLGYGAHLSTAPPFLRFPGLAEGLRQAGDYARLGMVAYLNGEVGQAWKAYYPEALALKTPIPLLAFYVWAACLAASLAARRAAPPARWIPLALAAAFFSAGLASKLDIGIRLVLPLYPFLAIQCGSLAPALSAAPGRRRLGAALALAGLVAWLAVESVRIVPHGISYFNQIAGGPANGWKYLGDSNLDWGQDLKKLPRTMRKLGLEEVILSYSGNAAPEWYGIRYQSLPFTRYASPRGDWTVDPAREVIAISVSNLQGIYARGIDYGWLRQRPPLARAGYGIHLHDITGDAEAHARLAAIYRANGLAGLAAKECDKVRALRGPSIGGMPIDPGPDPCPETPGRTGEAPRGAVGLDASPPDPPPVP